jgi:hypothetical protein
MAAGASRARAIAKRESVREARASRANLARNTKMRRGFCVYDDELPGVAA